jgi:hypothetical protein
MERNRCAHMSAASLSAPLLGERFEMVEDSLGTWGPFVLEAGIIQMRIS